MPRVVVRKVAELLNGLKKAVNGARVLLLGIAYKRDTGDVRESPALDIVRLLREQGARVAFHDPFNREMQVDEGRPLRRTALTPKNLAAADLVVVVTDHSSYDFAKIVQHAKLVLDTRNATGGLRPRPAKIHTL
jgi:UDP-N-acetyl-D-mannosaminuronate dehydrogenase